ncbi:MAG: flagellar hook-length control protein FliK, partial [Deltaproteobacteria bacterium]|nr:flagellar hook-length control protein FliK [Deltaproteobacteria bacterium]
DKNIHLTDEAQKQVKNDIELLLKEQGISEENIKSILDKINIAFSKMKLEKGAAHGESNPENHKLLTTLTGEKQVISGVLGDSVKQEIAAFLKNKGSSDKDIKSFFDSFSLDIKNTGTGQGDNLLKSSLLNEKVFGLIKNDQFISSADQGNLKLNIAEIINLAEKKAGAAQPDKLFEGLFKTTFKQGSTGKNNSDFLVKETNQVSGLNITQERAIKNIGNVNQAGNAAALPDPLPKIADRIMVMIRTGEYKSRMQITPPDLGKLDIDLTFKNGHIHASLSAENAAVKEIIEANLNQLKQQLTSQGLTVERFDVMVNLDNGKREDNNTWADGKAGKGSGHNTRSKSAAPSEIPVLQPAGAGLINDNRIDVHV